MIANDELVSVSFLLKNWKISLFSLASLLDNLHAKYHLRNNRKQTSERIQNMNFDLGHMPVD